jgi:chemotaxis protein MotB
MLITPKRIIDETEPWMMSYIDMATVLISFFIIIVSFSQFNPVKIEILSKYFEIKSQQQKEETIPLYKLAELFNNIVQESKLQHSVKVYLTDKGVEISVIEKILFDRGKADIREESIPILTEIGKLLNHPAVAKRKIVVEGHTDSLPIHTPKFASNWELSAARACEVIRFFERQGIDRRRFEAIGYADNKPVVKEEDPKLGQPLNRRVNLLIY